MVCQKVLFSLVPNASSMRVQYVEGLGTRGGSLFGGPVLYTHYNAAGITVHDVETRERLAA